MFNPDSTIDNRILDDIHSCTCFSLRKASRAVSQYFDKMLAPTGLKSTQVSMMAIIALNKTSTFAHLSDAMVMDRSTLTRNVRPLIRKEYLQVDRGTDKRVRLLSLTPKGTETLSQALPLWEEAQAIMVMGLKEQPWINLLDTLEETIKIASENK
jgi:DNA-binding MarR family transcriptional regulator